MQKLAVKILPGEVHDKAVFRNLMHLYLYDFSEHDQRDPDPQGLFEYAYLDQYWTLEWRNDGWMPFLITVDEQVVGFVLKGGRGHSHLENRENQHSINEFFVLRKWRRMGVGRRTAFELFDRFLGSWEVAQRGSNTTAQKFWRSVIKDYTGGSFQETVSLLPGWDGTVQYFATP